MAATPGQHGAGKRRGDGGRGPGRAGVASDPTPGGDRHGWAADVDALLAERAAAAVPPPAALPVQLSVSGLVDLGRDALRRCAGCTGGYRPGPMWKRCWARPFTTGCSGSTVRAAV